MVKILDGKSGLDVLNEVELKVYTCILIPIIILEQTYSLLIGTSIYTVIV